jgi:hypothetical protein
MCRKKARALLGIMKSVPQPQLPGRDGLTLVSYSGIKALDKFEYSILTGMAYEYGVDKPLFYVDDVDLKRVLNWSEAGKFVFEVAENGAGT